MSRRAQKGEVPVFVEIETALSTPKSILILWKLLLLIMVESSGDHLGVSGQEAYRKILDGGKAQVESNPFHTEPVLFSGKVKKINMFQWVQERVIIITDLKIYNIKKKQVKRIIGIESIEGLSKTTLPGSKEFTIHVPSEYDYRFVSD